MMFSQILLALALATFSLAYQVTSPGNSQGWTTEGSQLATWTRVDTDPLNFTAVLTNEDRSVMPQNNQILAALVDGTLGQIRLNPPNGGWPTGKAFRLNFCRDSQSLEAILAQSNQFDIGQTTSVPLSTPRSTTTPVANTSPAATVTQTPPTTSPSFEHQPPSVKLAAKIMASTKSFEHLLPPSWKTQVNAWLAEDAPSFDYGGYVVGEAHREAFLFGKGKTPAVLAGSPFFTEVFAQLGCDVKWHVQEGETFEPVKHVATVSGKARHLLLGERVALNMLARCSGIATKSKRVKDLARSYGYKGTIAGTRKTTPGFRLVEKYGMLVGGIDPHRHDLSSMIMLKDNHIWSSGSITAAIQQARAVGGFTLLLDVEVRNEAEADEAIDAGADIIMLDNMEGDELVDVARRLREKWNGKRKFLFESSGNITESNLQERAINEIDILSTSAVHQSVQHIDFSLKIQMPDHA
ncbi:hypothetical protein EYR36_006453 [Pleurotus pulmonarius]|nr:hypothetical protein EYR36_006453 [Pleurotus pulmonarius]KAF4601153.1 hypothetical protein EYR38_005803 [Pleurotus pulmonarius]